MDRKGEVFTEVGSVKNQGGENICVVSVGFRPYLKSYEKIPIVMRENANNSDPVQLGKVLVEFLKEHPEVADYNEITIAFPYQGGLLLKLDVLGNMTDELYEELVYVFATSICELLMKWFVLRYPKDKAKVDNARSVRNTMVALIMAEKRRNVFQPETDVLFDQVAECRWF